MISMLEQLLLVSVVIASRCFVCGAQKCDSWLWEPEGRGIRAIHARCMRVS